MQLVGTIAHAVSVYPYIGGYLQTYTVLPPIICMLYYEVQNRLIVLSRPLFSCLLGGGSSQPNCFNLDLAPASSSSGPDFLFGSGVTGGSNGGNTGSVCMCVCVCACVCVCVWAVYVQHCLSIDLLWVLQGSSYRLIYLLVLALLMVTAQASRYFEHK